MGNFSRDTFDKLKHYVGVRLQQGVPIVDADWNEQDDIRKYELQAFLKWFVGNGVPDGNDGFHIHRSPNTENDFRIQDGICLVEGWDVINNSTLRYTGQRLYDDDTMALITPETDRTDTVYLDVWEREVDATEDTDLVNPAIGVETCVRLKREWVVRVAEGQTELPTPPEGHVYYPLASLSRKAADGAVIKDIADLRQTGLSLAALEAEIADARGLMATLGNRLDKSLTEGGELQPNVVGSEQIADDAVNNANVAPNSLVYDKLRSREIWDFETNVSGTEQVNIGAADAFRLVSVNVTAGSRDLEWHLKSGYVASFPNVLHRTLVVLQNNAAEEVTVRVRAYIFSDPG